MGSFQVLTVNELNKSKYYTTMNPIMTVDEEDDDQAIRKILQIFIL